MVCTISPERMVAMFQPYNLEVNRSSTTSLQANPSYEVNLVLLFNLNRRGELSALRKPIKVLKLTSDDLTKPLEYFFDEKVRSPQQQPQATPPDSPIPLYSVAQVFKDIRISLDHDHKGPFDCSVCDKCKILGESLLNLQQTFAALSDRMVDSNPQKKLFEKARDIGKQCLQRYTHIFSAVVGRPSSEPPAIFLKLTQSNKRSRLSTEERPKSSSSSPLQLLRAASAPNLERLSKSAYTSPIESPLREEQEEPTRFVFPGPDEYAKTP